MPILTRYRKEVALKVFVKKELHDPRLPDMRKSSEINVLTTPTLCVQLNTLYVSCTPVFQKIAFAVLFSISAELGGG